MAKFRYDRIGEELKREISDILMHEIKDPDLGFVSVLSVDVTSDLQQAKVYFSVMGGAEQVAAGQEVVKRSAGFIRRELAHRLSLRHTPELIFIYDNSIEHGIRIAQLLNEENQKRRTRDDDEETEQE